MKFGFGVLRLSPGQFWSMSVRELEAAMQAVWGTPPQPLTPEWLENAMSAHPDVSEESVKP